MHSLYFYRKVTQNVHFTSLSNTVTGGGKVVSTTLLNLPKNWVIYIGDNNGDWSFS